MKKALVFLRVSTEIQEDRNSLENQERQALAYCNYKGYTIYKKIKTVVSGRKNDRADFSELKEEIEKNNFDVLIFYELSRLSRSAYFIHELAHSLRMKNIEFESITEPQLNSDSPVSKIIFSLMASLAEHESDVTSKRVRNRMKHLASEGYHPFNPPLGYGVKDNVLYIKEEEAAKIRSIFNDFISGYSLKKLEAKYGYTYRGIQKMLSNVVYIGKTKFGFERHDLNTGKRVKGLEGEVFEGKHEAIIDEKTFNLAAKILNNKNIKITRDVLESNLLSGVLKHSCGSRMYGRRILNRAKMTRYRLYACSSCQKGVSANNIEKIVLDSIKERCEKLDFLNIKKPTKKVKNHANKIVGLKNKRKRIIDTYADGFISRDEYTERVKEIDLEMNKLKEEMKSIEPDIQDITLKEKLLKDIKNIDKKKDYEKKQIIKLFVDEIIFDKESGIEIAFKF